MADWIMIPSPSLSTVDTGIYRVRIQNSRGVVLSDPVQVTVIASTPTPRFTLTPRSITVHEGGSFALTPTATADGGVTYAWFKNGQPQETIASTLPFLSAVSTDAGRYTVAATGTGGTTTAEPAVVAVVSPLVLDVPRVDADGLHLSFNGIAGRLYFLESRSDLLEGDWTEAGETVVSGTPEFLISAAPAGPRFYWVEVR